MKKIMVFLLLLLLPISVRAENIIDDYVIRIDVSNYTVNVRETFKVIDANDVSNNFTHKIFADNEKVINVESDITDLQKIVEGSYVDTYFMGTVEAGREYFIEYVISDFSRFGTHAYDYYSPLDTTVKNFTYIVKGDDMTNAAVWRYQMDIFKENKGYNIVTGKLVSESNDFDFSVNVNVYEDTNSASPIQNFFGRMDGTFWGSKDNREFAIIILLTLVIALAIFGFEWFTNKTLSSRSVLGVLILIILMVAIQIGMFEPFLLLPLLVYLAFYLMLLFKGFHKSKGVDIVLFIFLTFHSSFFLGLAIGILPNIINNIAIFIMVKLYSKALNDR